MNGGCMTQTTPVRATPMTLISTRPQGSLRTKWAMMVTSRDDVDVIKRTSPSKSNWFQVFNTTLHRHTFILEIFNQFSCLTLIYIYLNHDLNIVRNNVIQNYSNIRKKQRNSYTYPMELFVLHNK